MLPLGHFNSARSHQNPSCTPKKNQPHHITKMLITTFISSALAAFASLVAAGPVPNDQALPGFPSNDSTCTYRYNWASSRDKYHVTGADNNPTDFLHQLLLSRIHTKDVSYGMGSCRGGLGGAGGWWVTFRVHAHVMHTEIEDVIWKAGGNAICGEAQSWAAVCGKGDRSS